MEKKKSDFNIVTIVTNAFDSFVKVFKKNGVATVSYILILFMFFYAFIINPVNINSIVEKALIENRNNIKTDKDNSVQKRMAADEVLIPVMEDIAEREDVSRVLLFEKHNNSQNISGIDFLFLSSTYECISPDDIELDYIGDSFQRQYVTNFLGKEILGLLKYKKYLYYNHIEDCNHTNHRLLHKLRRFDAKSVMLIPFLNDNKQPLLILAVISNKGEIDYNEIYNKLKPFESNIKQSLM